MIAADRWKPPRSSIPLHLYRCDQQPPHLAGAAVLGWSDLAADITVWPLQSRHGGHIRPPAVTQLAALVRDDLARGQARGDRRSVTMYSSPEPALEAAGLSDEKQESPP